MPLSFFEKKYENCIVNNTTLKKQECSITNIPQSAVVVDLDEAGSPLLKKSRCDYLVILSNGDSEITAFGIELKGGNLDASKVGKQLRSTTTYVNGLNCINDFFPIVLFKSVSHPSQMKKIRNIKLKYGSEDKRIILCKCGDTFMKVLSEANKTKNGTIKKVSASNNKMI